MQRFAWWFAFLEKYKYFFFKNFFPTTTTKAKKIMESGAFGTTGTSFTWVNFGILCIMLLERAIHWLYMVRSSNCKMSVFGCLKCMGDMHTDAEQMEKNITTMTTPSKTELKDAGIIEKHLEEDHPDVVEEELEEDHHKNLFTKVVDDMKKI